MKTFLSPVIASIIFVLGLFTPGFAQDNTHNDEALSIGLGFPDFSQTFQGRIGLGLGFFPEYEGSDNYEISALPLVDIGKPGAFFLKGASINANDGLASAGLTVFHFSYSKGSVSRMHIIMGPLIRAYSGRDESDSPILRGLGNIEHSLGLGGFLTLSAGAWQANATLTPQDVGNDKDGLLFALDLKYSATVSDGFMISTGVSTSWADDDYMQGYFGVTDLQVLRTGFSRFNRKAGFKDVGLQLNVVYDLSPRWSLEGQAGYWHLLNEAADSPIVEGGGSANQVRGLVGLLYRF